MSKIQIVQCDSCYKNLNMKEDNPAEERGYYGFFDYHLCTGCASTMTVKDFIVGIIIPRDRAKKEAEFARKIQNGKT